ncbi:hypothetical protein [Massilia brevitalea]|uniref:hypothetical protein n=1 Tax=Massilia brevitalea TaxID=442526 RepID=UPI002739D52B|nr:hypothetical protein [Massilia brevitalea]
MKNMLRAIRRHHAARLKKARRSYSGRYDPADPRLAGLVLHTPKCCSCWMCGHARRHSGRTLAELRHLADLAEQV